MASVSTTPSPHQCADQCSVCRYPHVDLRLAGCGCAFHVTCVPLSLIFNDDRGVGKGSGVSSGGNISTPCSFCQTGSFTGLYVEPLPFEDIDKAIALRRKASLSPIDGAAVESNSPGGSGERSEEDRHVRATFNTYSQVKPVINSGLRDAEGSGRTGRWTDGEVEFVDHIVTLFDQGELPLPNGAKLGTFLGDILLCRTSRLTKKMKKAKLGARTFELKSRNSGQFSTQKDYEFLSMLQEGFVRSMPEEYTQVEIRFNLARQWRTYFLELCLQAGYSRVVAGDWISSLDEFDKRASVAKEQVRALDRRMIKTSFQSESSQSLPTSNSLVSAPLPTREDITINSTRIVASSADDFASGAINKRMLDKADPKIGLDLDIGEPKPKRPRSGSEDLDALIGLMEDAADDAGQGPAKEEESSDDVEVYNSRPRTISSAAPKTFPDVIAAMMESHDLPFDYADFWVPSYVQSQGSGDAIRLLSAGHATRRDIPSALNLADFGEYSQKFSFDSGSGLPGRVFSTGKSRWEYKVCDSDPCFFLRAEGARTHGIKTAVGIPFSTPGMGKIVVVFYSRQELEEDSSIAALCLAGLAKFSPAPKWKLIVDKAGRRNDNSVVSGESSRYSSATGALLPPTALVPLHGAKQQLETSSQHDADPTFKSVHSIISLLGGQMSARPEADRADLSSQMLNLRLFLLTPSSRLSDDDAGVISILTSSFEHYSADKSRSQSEIAQLLTREWTALRAAQNSQDPSASDTYRRHLMDPTLARAMASSPNGLSRPMLSLQKLSPNLKPQDSSMLVYDHSKIPMSLANVPMNLKSRQQKDDQFSMGPCDHGSNQVSILEPDCSDLALHTMACNPSSVRKVSTGSGQSEGGHFSMGNSGHGSNQGSILEPGCSALSLHAMGACTTPVPSTKDAIAAMAARISPVASYFPGESFSLEPGTMNLSG